VTTERVVIRLDESKVVVIRKVPMTGDTCDKLRILRSDMEEDHFKDTGKDVEIPFPVVIDMLIEQAFNNRGVSK